MNLIDFSRTAYKSANMYFEYVRENGKSRETINIIAIKEIENRLFYLRISKKLYQIDSTYFTFNSPLIKIERVDEEAASDKRIRILEYDESEPSIIVSVEDDFYDTFRQLNANEMQLVSDLSFLIKATRDWYRYNHKRICFPGKNSYGNIALITPKSISDEQTKAVKTVLSSAVSYVWGAPGTGKTQVVLSSCIASIVDYDSAVLVVGPTNNAVEQSLNGIIRMFENADVDINMVLRMGKASRAFSLKYPDLCEKGSIMKELAQLDSEIKIIEKRFLEYELARRLTNVKDKILSLYNEKSKNEKEFFEIEDKLAFCVKEEKNLKCKISDLEASIAKLTKSVNDHDIYQRMVDIYEPLTTLNETINELKEKIKILNQEKDTCTLESSKLDDKIKEHIEVLCNLQRKVTSLKKKTKSIVYKVSSFFGGKQRDEAIAEINSLEPSIKVEEEKLAEIYVQREAKNNEQQRISEQMEEINIQLSVETNKVKELMYNNGFVHLEVEGFYDYLSGCVEQYQNSGCDIDNIRKQLKEAEASAEGCRQALAENDNDLKKANIENGKLQESKERISKEIIALLTAEVKEDFDFGSDMGEKLVLRLLALDVSDDTYNSLKKRIEEKGEQYNSLKGIVDSTYKKKRIFACTIDYLILHYAEFVDLIEDKLKFAFLDEAAYCSMIKAAPIFSLGVPVGLFGDHMQLPPICEMENKTVVDRSIDLSFLWSQSSLYFPDIFIKDIDVSELRDMYYDGDDPRFEVVERAVLTNTYRFGENLAKVLDMFVYKTGFHGVDSDTEVIVIDAPRMATEIQLRENHSEVTAIKEYLKSNKQESLIILTPYKKQRDLIQKELYYRQEVCTIHASQGREWDTVILSVVDAERKFFTDSAHKQSKGLKIINTAISRAKKQLVIVCDKSYWISLKDKQLIGNLVYNANN
ncbi:MAG: ATP-binding domain-containing protein [Clostridia bacterium]|nr:ATP-binding domain-containing protein [Clostridia bacterium]